MNLNFDTIPRRISIRYGTSSIIYPSFSMSTDFRPVVVLRGCVLTPEAVRTTLAGLELRGCILHLGDFERAVIGIPTGDGMAVSLLVSAVRVAVEKSVRVIILGASDADGRNIAALLGGASPSIACDTVEIASGATPADVCSAVQTVAWSQALRSAPALVADGIPASVTSAFRLTRVAPAGRQSGNINSVFACVSEAHPRIAGCFLRLTPSSHRSLPEVEAEVRWLRELTAAGLCVAEPLPAADGRFVVPYGGGVAVLLRAVGGRPARRPGAANGVPADCIAPVITAWALALARLHNHAAAAAAASCWAGAHLTGRRDWDEDAVLAAALTESSKEGGGCEVSPATSYCVGPVELQPPLARALSSLRRVLNAEVAWMRVLPRTRGNFGATHADLQFTNFNVVEAGEDVSIAAFDFDDCCRHYLVNDVAVAIVQLRKEGMMHAPVAALGLEEAFLRAYLSERRFAPETSAPDPVAELREWLPRFVRFRAALIVCWAAHELREGRLSGPVAHTWFRDALPVYEAMCQ